MKISKKAIAIGAAASIAAALWLGYLIGQQEESMPLVALSLSASASPLPANLPASEVLTWDCEIPEQKPTTMMIMCADGGIYIEKIRWSSWSKEGATGTGIFSENLCDPSCAEGQRVEASVNLKLSDLTEQDGKYYLRSLDVSTTDGKDFPWGRTNGFEWDVMEFAEMMNEE